MAYRDGGVYSFDGGRRTHARTRGACIRDKGQSQEFVLPKPSRSILKKFLGGVCNGMLTSTHISKASCRRLMAAGDLTQGYYSRLRQAALRRNFCFEVSAEFLWQLFLQQEGRCALSGRRIYFDPKYNRKRKKAANDVTASLDRKDSTKGYTEDNVQWVDKRFNKLKNNFDEKTLLVMCQDILETHQAKIRREADKNRSS